MQQGSDHPVQSAVACRFLCYQHTSHDVAGLEEHHMQECTILDKKNCFTLWATIS
ncbi:hypothetical protein QKW52_24740 [Bacillus sonorensis]|nr:hypothetical protein [Bacillus sonorensis]